MALTPLRVDEGEPRDPEGRGAAIHRAPRLIRSSHCAAPHASPLTPHASFIRVIAPRPAASLHIGKPAAWRRKAARLRTARAAARLGVDPIVTLKHSD